MSVDIATPLLKWYKKNGRQGLPWRHSILPYSIWLSEVMLQQTQVKTVINYFNRFVIQFPTVIDLANAHEDEVLHLWSGLGYYSRARNLHKSAKLVRDKYQGEFPNELTELMNLPGVGRSTAGAICAIAFKQPTPILDGNVKRVLSRVFAIKGWPGTSANQTSLWDYAEQLTPEKNADDYTQAIMDLGATLCTRTKPQCNLCPIQSECLAFKKNLTHAIPAPKPKRILPEKSRLVLIIENSHGHILLEKRPPVGIWGGLWCLPVCELEEDVIQFCFNSLGLKVKPLKPLSPFRHTFSHYHLHIHPLILKVSNADTEVCHDNLNLWYNPHKPKAVGLPAPIKKLLRTPILEED